MWVHPPEAGPLQFLRMRGMQMPFNEMSDIQDITHQPPGTEKTLMDLKEKILRRPADVEFANASSRSLGGESECRDDCFVRQGSEASLPATRWQLDRPSET
ncbi:hypothetical protein NW754_008947 [Fusarium falciforme]|uniref:Uncharacterized protein n=1 Tax=Fusarium falciforme TaxID=195108 RepID=A0A9W8V1K0_9HYPO|nr:hypothetical protein NW754_008947 [Fusarium falciforme]KAJ4191409.1 hypothetical protein NW755_004595 [Fusarium falciforme]KAJ4194446.1 hypothetical protein NW767_009947 [Fusarium falciforme]KAJ4261167.1 hypothetical protein NW757_001555 [Fusarium falciforme]